MSTPEWIEYTGSDEQIAEMWNAEHGYAVISRGVIKIRVAKDSFSSREVFSEHAKNAIEYVTKYLICQPHPYADLIDIWRLSGCTVWVRYRNALSPKNFIVEETNKPDWNIPGAEYRLTPFED